MERESTTWLLCPVADDGSVMEGIRPIRMHFYPGNAPPEAIADFFCALSDLQKAHGGNGIRFKVDSDD